MSKDYLAIWKDQENYPDFTPYLEEMLSLIYELQEQLKQANVHIGDLLESQEEECRYDHRRNCQEHGWFGLNGEDCPTGQAFVYHRKYNITVKANE